MKYTKLTILFVLLLVFTVVSGSFIIGAEIWIGEQSQYFANQYISVKGCFKDQNDFLQAYCQQVKNQIYVKSWTGTVNNLRCFLGTSRAYLSGTLVCANKQVCSPQETTADGQCCAPGVPIRHLPGTQNACCYSDQASIAELVPHNSRSNVNTAYFCFDGNLYWASEAGNRLGEFGIPSPSQLPIGAAYYPTAQGWTNDGDSNPAACEYFGGNFIDGKCCGDDNTEVGTVEGNLLCSQTAESQYRFLRSQQNPFKISEQVSNRIRGTMAYSTFSTSQYVQHTHACTYTDNSKKCQCYVITNVDGAIINDYCPGSIQYEGTFAKTSSNAGNSCGCNEGPSGTYAHDLVSNSENWYYCNANGLAPNRGGISLGKFETFPMPDFVDPSITGYFCPNGQTYVGYAYNCDTDEDGCNDEAEYAMGGQVAVETFDINPCKEAGDYPVEVAYQESFTGTNTEGYVSAEDITGELLTRTVDTEICDNLIDDDEDDKIDCSDVDCQDNELCRETYGENPELYSSMELCYDDVDNDGDNLIDCKDPDCAEYVQCIPAVEHQPGEEYSYNINLAFTCYDESGNNLIAECCHRGNCQNYDISKVFGKSGMLHEVKKFDKLEGSSIEDRAFAVHVDTVPTDGGVAHIRLNESDIRDWNGFEYLEFDMISNYPIKSLIIKNIDGENIFDDDLISYSTSFLGAKKWHHIVIRIKDIDTSKPIDSMHFYVYKPRPNSKITDVKFYIDKIFISNRENAYCSGAWGTWLRDLDPPSNADELEIEQYAYTCGDLGSGIQSFGWTGSKCCGDDFGLDYNLVKNPSYELELSSWILNSPSLRIEAKIQEQDVDDGLKAMYFAASSIGSANPAGVDGDHGGYYQRLKVEPGEEYVLRVKAKIEEHSYTTPMRVYIGHIPGTIDSIAEVTSTTDGWQTFEGTFRAQSDTINLYPIYLVHGGKVWFDSIQLEKGNQLHEIGEKSQSEYYSDSNAGCWNSYTISENQSIGDSINDKRENYHRQLVFSNGNFVLCDENNAVNQNPYYIQYTDSRLYPELSIVPKQRYCQVIGPYFCDYSNEWSSDDSGSADSYDRNDSKDITAIKENFNETLPNFRLNACCPKNYCWNGVKCVEGLNEFYSGTFAIFKDSFIGQYNSWEEFENESTAYVCRLVDGTAQWGDSVIKYKWDDIEFGFCPETTQCFDGEKCVESEYFTQDRYCLEGNWTSRTKILAEELMSIAGNSDFDLYCDNAINIVNRIKYNVKDSSGNSILAQNILNSGANNNFCVIEYDGKVAVGTSINEEVNNKMAFLFEANSCPEDNRNLYVECDTEKDYLWYNNKTRILIYSNTYNPPTIPAGTKFRDIFLHPFYTIQQIFTFSTPKIITDQVKDIPFAEKTKDYRQLFIAKKTEGAIKKEVIGFIEEINPNERYMFVSYVEFDEDVCKAAEKQGLDCNSTTETQFIVNDENIPIWRQDWHELGAELRIK